MRRNANPAPDLHALVERRGGYANITPEEWGAHDRALAEWQERRRMRSEGFLRQYASAALSASVGGRASAATPRSGGAQRMPVCGPITITTRGERSHDQRPTH